MKKIVTITLCVLMLTGVVGCGSAKTESNAPSAQNQQKQIKLKTAEEISAALKSKGLPIGTVVVYTAENDANKLLGRPNQYTSKVNFADTTLDQSDPTDQKGGSVEFFKTATDVKARKDYIDNIGKQSPMFIEYSYINGTALLRLSKDLTPDQATQYEKVFKDLFV